ncbi:MAG: hypothetical protein HY690_05640 [Chloroflexi bacterium]|nr:hypothetical protein [Chloroflexota bacterium]
MSEWHEMTPSSWLLLYLAYESPDGEPAPEMSPIQIQKGLFLLWQAARLPSDQAYAFRADAYGPLSPQIYQDMDLLADTHLVHARKDPRVEWSYYKATDKAKALAMEIVEEEHQAQRYLPYIEVVRGLIRQLSFRELVSGISAAYPEYSVATVAPDLLPDGARGVTEPLATLLTPEEIQFRVEALLGYRQLRRGEYVTRGELLRR